jgi:hypothetical protein
MLREVSRMSCWAWVIHPRVTNWSGDIPVAHVNLDDFQLLAHPRTVAHLVGRLRAGNKDVAAPDLSRHPSIAKLALTELCRPCQAAGDQRLGSGRHEEPIHDPWEMISPHMKA